MKRLLTFIVILMGLIGTVMAENLADNPLEPLFSAKKVNWAVQIDGMYPEFVSNSEIDQFTLTEKTESHTFEINVIKPAKIKASYLYIILEGYDCITIGCEPWTVRFNGYTLANDEHTVPLGNDSRGDGKSGTGGRQLVRFDVEGLVENGDNSVFIRMDDWQIGSEQVYIDGVVLLTFYETQGQHEYWLYNGVEYLEIKLVGDDTFYAEDLESSTYPEESEGTLYILTGVFDDDGNGFEEDDALYFNDNLIEPSESDYILGTYDSRYLDFFTFDVTNYLDGSDEIKFSFVDNPEDWPATGLEHEVPTYPMLFLLDVDLSDSTPPEIIFTGPLNNSKFPGNMTVPLNFTVNDPDASATVEIDGSEVTPIKITLQNWSYSWDLEDVSLGLHNITATATDTGDNIGSATIFINVTKPAPKVIIISPQNESVHSKEDNVTISVSIDENDVNVSIEIDGEKVGDTPIFKWDTSSVEEGFHTIIAKATDALGQTGSDSIIVNVTETKINGTTTTTSTTTTIGEQTTSTTTSTTSTTTTTTTTLPPQTSPPITAPPIPKIDLAINSLTLSPGSSTIKFGTDITAHVLASNARDSDVEGTIVLYFEDNILDSKTTTIKAYELKELEFPIKGSSLEPGEHTIMAIILAQGVTVEDVDRSNNERSIKIMVDEDISIFDNLKPFLKWLAIVLVIIVGARVIITFITQGEDDYLR
jgi:hypothetical protein